MSRWMPPCEWNFPFLPGSLCRMINDGWHAKTDTLTAHREEKNLEELSSLGHFLKGSSATLGFTKVKDECEKIQHYGHKKNETGESDEPDEEKCLRLIGESIKEAKQAYEVVSNLMNRFYAET